MGKSINVNIHAAIYRKNNSKIITKRTLQKRSHLTLYKAFLESNADEVGHEEEEDKQKTIHDVVVREVLTKLNKSSLSCDKPGQWQDTQQRYSFANQISEMTQTGTTPDMNTVRHNNYTLTKPIEKFCKTFLFFFFSQSGHLKSLFL